MRAVKLAAVIAIVVVIDRQINPSINRSGKSCLAANEERLRRLAVA